MAFFGEYNTQAIQSEDFQRRLKWLDTSKKPQSLAGFRALYVIRESNDGPILLEATTENQMVGTFAGPGLIDIRIPYNLINRINPGICVHELVLIAGNESRRVVFRGTIEIVRGIAVNRQGSTYYISDSSGTPVLGQNT